MIQHAEDVWCDNFVLTFSTIRLSLYEEQLFEDMKWFSVVFVSRKSKEVLIKIMAPTPNPAKALLRTEIAAKIAALSTEEKKRQSKIVYDKLINHPWYQSAKRISLFMSTDEEIDTAPIIKHIQAREASAFVPQYAGGRMRFLKLESGDESEMPLTKHGIQQHSKEQLREDAMETGGLDLVIAPGVAFTKEGGRCGHGGGYYDKFIANMRTTSNPAKILAVAFSCQVVDNVPMDEQDQRIDGVIFADN